jgi:uncharacterized protein YjbI with pentapeptide repeats/beta-lactamase regulating signal transducer with metallopeptidase domain
VIQFGLAVLFNSLWVALLVALGVQAVFWIVPRTNATTRYAAWTLALVASVLVSVAITLPHLSTAGATAPATVAHEAQPLAAAHAAQGAPRVFTTQAAARTGVTTEPKSAPPAPRVHLSVPAFFAPLPFVLWAVVAIAILVRLTLALAQLEGLKRDALPVPIDVRDGLSAWEQANKGDRDVRLCTSERITVPVAVGLFDSLILIPSRLLATLSRGEIDQILLHELAHLRRADDWTNCFQRIVEALFFFNPAMLWMARKLDVEREVACDDWVVTQTRDIRPYALCLTRMAEVTAWPHRALAAPGVFITRRSLSIRVERLLAAGRNIGTSIALGPAGIVAAALVVLVFVAQTVAPSIAFTLPSPPKPVAPPQIATVPATPKMQAVAPKQKAAPAPAALTYRVHLKEHHLEALARVRAVVASTIAASAAGMNCTGCDFGAARWSGRDLHGANLTGSRFANADLRDVDFSGANLSAVDFQGANLAGANFSDANLSGANLRNADLTGVNFSGSNLSGSSIDVARLSPSQARAVLVRCKGCDMEGADLRGQDLHGISLSGVNLASADLSGADLSGAHFAGVDLSHARMTGARLDGASFVGCDFSKVDLRNVDLSKARISGSDLSSATLR